MNEPPIDAPLEAALRAVSTPPLAAADRDAIRAALRAAAAAPPDPTRSPAPRAASPGAPGAPAPLALLALAAGLGAGLWALARPAASPAPATDVAPAATVVARAVRPAAQAPSAPRAAAAVAGVATAVAPPAAVANRTTVPRPAGIAVAAASPGDAAAAEVEPPVARHVADAAADDRRAPAASADATRRPTATPGPVLPVTPSGKPAMAVPTWIATSVSPGPPALPETTATPSRTGIAGRVRIGGAGVALVPVRAVAADGDDGRFVVGATEADGTYRLALPAGRWWVVAEPDGAPARWWPGAAEQAGAEPVVVVDGRETTGIDLDIEPAPGSDGTMGR